jgi:hypothetical protein
MFDELSPVLIEVNGKMTPSYRKKWPDVFPNVEQLKLKEIATKWGVDLKINGYAINVVSPEEPKMTQVAKPPVILDLLSLDLKTETESAKMPVVDLFSIDFTSTSTVEPIQPDKVDL